METDFIVCQKCEKEIERRRYEMTREEALKILDVDRLSYDEEEAEKFSVAYDMATSALELLGHLIDRPCGACEFKKEQGCCKWECVFDKLIHEERSKTLLESVREWDEATEKRGYVN